MTTIVAISDTHGHKVELSSADLLLHSGDFCMHGTLQELIPQLDWLASQRDKYKHIVITMGNHDWIAARQPTLVKELCKDRGLIYLCDETVTVEGLKIFGSPYQPNFCNWAFNEPRGEALKRHWDLIEVGTDIIMTHGPVHGIQDYIPWDDEHVGCRDLADKVFQVKPKLFVAGHIHLHGGKIEEFNGIKFVNASMVNEAYELVNNPIIIDL